MAACECLSVVAQTLSPAQLATHRHPPPSPQTSDTCVHCRASNSVLFSAICALHAVQWHFFDEDTTLIAENGGRSRPRREPSVLSQSPYGLAYFSGWS